jgi:hypothetical protein
MKIKLALLLITLLATGGSLHAQVNNQLRGAGAPSGSCTSSQTYLDTTNHVLYSCNNGTWSASQGLGNLTGRGWDALLAPASNLSILMGSNTSIFNTTSAVPQFFAWKNTTAAVVGTSQGSPLPAICGRAFHGSADVEDCMTIATLPGNGNDAAIQWTLGHTGASTGPISILLPLTTTTSVLQFGGTSAGFPGLRASGIEITAVLANASDFANFRAAKIQAATFTPSGNVLISSTAPTISSGFGTGASIPSQNGTAAFTINVGTTSAATGVIGLPSATTGWNCFATDITTTSTTIFITKQTASTQTTATIGNFSDVAAAVAWADNDILRVSCFAY